MVKIPGVYKQGDPAVSFNIWVKKTYNLVPGPAVWGGGGGGGGGGNNAPQQNQNQAQQPQANTTVTASSGGGGGGGSCAALYGQCGGTGYSGPKCCQSSQTCKATNEYYSQCV